MMFFRLYSAGQIERIRPHCRERDEGAVQAARREQGRPFGRAGRVASIRHAQKRGKRQSG